MLPPYTPRPESEIVSSAIDRVHPKLVLMTGSSSSSGSDPCSSDHGHGHVDGSLESMAKIAEMYAGLCAEVGIRCEVLEEALKVRQERVIGRLNEGESGVPLLLGVEYE
jgi:hypothetical protein